ncbi:MAG: biotin/lipoyl-containing protein [Acidobacteriota bacterium]
MPARVHVLVDSQPLTVEVRDDDVIVAGDDAVPLRVVGLGDGRYRIDGPDGAFDAIAAVAGDRIWIAVGDETFECRIGTQAASQGSVDAGDSLSSPMPATVTAVPVSVGQTIEAGDVLIALEAMKMELPLRAPRRGIVAALHCHVGDLVQPDVVLVEIRGE